MKITIRQENETTIRLHSDDMRIGDYVTPKEELFETMKDIEKLVKRCTDTCVIWAIVEDD